MTTAILPPDIQRILEDTSARQARAADPRASVWVSANAGTGKTHVLTMRTLRLLLSGTAPECILCLTYTKAAAAEMSARVFGALATWVTATDRDLQEMLATLLLRPASDEETARARTLFAFAIETPGGLKVQTIHAFCERLLQRFPLEAGVPPGFSVLDDDLLRSLTREAIDNVLRRATGEPDGALGRALDAIIAYAADDRFDAILSSAISERSFLEDAVRVVAGGENGNDEFRDIELVLRDTLRVAHDATLEAVVTSMSSVLLGTELSRLVAALAEGGKSDQKHAALLGLGIGLSSPERKIELFASYFLTGEGKPRASLMTKSVKQAHPDLDTLVTRAQGVFHKHKSQRTALRTIDATLALIRLSSAVMQAYTNLKARRAGLDYDDLIEKTANLLATSENADWVLYKLDGGLDHILVDESQDTSPAQWRIIEALAAEFFSGEGARENARTLFAVGDEKQSIYSFQGAAPEQFSQMGKRFRDRAARAERPWEQIPLNMSFRTVPPVLQAVDLVFGERARTPGLGDAAGRDAISHVAARHGRGGLVEVWPTVESDDVPSGEVWAPADETAREAPAQRLANDIAETIHEWINSGELLVSENRPIRPRDILILVRKRNPFSGPMVGALKARNIPVAGADRVNLVEQIAVMDLVALGDFLVLPEDDLALACVLKSPMFAFNDDDLFSIAGERKGTLWKALLDSKGAGEKFNRAVQLLLSWRKRADFMPPFEFFSGILDTDGMRTKMLARLGGEAAEPLDEFLHLMISFDEAAPPSLSGFLAWLRAGKREIKRDMDQGTDEVRVMTVHGAKGLEAPIVFLPDTCTTSTGAMNASGFVSIDTASVPAGMEKMMMWNVKGSGALEAFQTASARQKDADRDERNRLLYVAMTRARDRLYVAGFEGVRGRQAGCWYDLIVEGLGEKCERISDARGRDVLLLSAPQTMDIPDTPKHADVETETPQAPPTWAQHAAPVEPALNVPLSPSKLAPYDTDEEGEPIGAATGPEKLAGSGNGQCAKNKNGDDVAVEAALPDEPAAVLVRSGEDERRFLRGTITHALLEHLPGLSADTWHAAARDYVDLRGSVLAANVRKSIVGEVLAILDDPEFGALFGPDSQAEVAVGADIPNPDGVGPPLRLSGFIDRLAIVGNDVLIVDYKTNRPPPHDVVNVADAYLYQLAAYRLALKEIYNESTIRAALLWTQDARLMEIPDAILEKYGSQLWQLARAAP